MNRLAGIDAKFERVDTHIREAEVHVQEFFAASPYEIYAYADSDSGDYVWIVRVHADPPLILGVIASEVFHHLRSILDHLVWQLIEANGRDPSKQRSSFPISDSHAEFESGGMRQARHVGDKAMHLIKAAKSYKGGNDSLWRLHELSRIDKHRVPIPVGSSAGSVGLDLATGLRETAKETWGSELPEMRVFINPADRQFPLKDGAEVFRVRSGIDRSQIDMDPHFKFHVAFGEGEVLEGEPILPALRDFVSLVRDTLGPFRALLT